MIYLVIKIIIKIHLVNKFPLVNKRQKHQLQEETACSQYLIPKAMEELIHPEGTHELTLEHCLLPQALLPCITKSYHLDIIISSACPPNFCGLCFRFNPSSSLLLISTISNNHSNILNHYSSMVKSLIEWPWGNRKAEGVAWCSAGKGWEVYREDDRYPTHLLLFTLPTVPSPTPAPILLGNLLLILQNLAQFSPPLVTFLNLCQQGN